MNIVEVLAASVEKHPDKIAFIQNGKSITYHNLYKKAERLAQKMRGKGIKRGDNILIFIPLSIDLYVAMVAVWILGARAIFIDFSRGKDFINASIERLRPDLILCDKITYFMRYFLGNLKRINTLNINFVFGQTSDKIEITKVDADDGAILSFTSGTTGLAKIALRSHQFLLEQYKVLRDELYFTDEQIDLGTLPIFSLINLAVGITTLLPDKRYKANVSIEKLAKRIEKYQPTRIICSPSLIEQLLPYNCLDSIAHLYLGGAAVFPSLLDKIDKRVQLYILYGSTEAEPIAKFKWCELDEKKAHIMKTRFALPAGYIAPSIKCRIIDDEIVVSGKTVLQGYLNGIGDKENKLHLDGEIWHRTGDAGFIDDDGMLWLWGRVSQKVGDFYPLMVEMYLDLQFAIKSAFLEYKGEKMVVIENAEHLSDEEVLKAIENFGINKVVRAKKIPRDKRHNAKVDLAALKRLLETL